MERRIRIGILSFVFAAATVIAILLIYHQVDVSLTTVDVAFIEKFLRDSNTSPRQRSHVYKEEIQLILDSQRAVLGGAPGTHGIPYDAPREPKDVYLAKSGLCYDKSRVIEKILRFYGFETRHIAIYSTERTKSAFLSLITPGVSSHSVTEVLTSKGWLVVDSNDPWISLDHEGDPVSMDRMQSDVIARKILWSRPFPTGIYEKPFTFVYGLYSRHGRFYPPYDCIPDMNYKELMQNFR